MCNTYKGQIINRTIYRYVSGSEKASLYITSCRTLYYVTYITLYTYCESR